MENRALEQLLSKARVTIVPIPLEALIAQDFGLQANPDYPLAALAACADGLVVGEGYWLRADPVHLILQRDSFSLGEPVPLVVLPEQAEAVLTSLNRHFAEDGIEFLRGVSGAWYVKVAHAPQIKTTLPHAVLGRNVHGFMPQGTEAAKWRSLVNELQMLLFEHPVNLVREQQGALAINSIWLSGGGDRASLVKYSALKPRSTDLVLADTPLYQGLAQHVGINCEKVPEYFETLLSAYSPTSHLRLLLSESGRDWFELIMEALKKRRLELLTLNIGCYEKCLVAQIRPWDLYRLWRRSKPVESFLL